MQEIGQIQLAVANAEHLLTALTERRAKAGMPHEIIRLDSGIQHEQEKLAGLKKQLAELEPKRTPDQKPKAQEAKPKRKPKK